MRIYYSRNELIWIAPGAVTYDREQVEFLLPWLLEMREGVYPAEPEGGYVDGGGHSRKTRAYYEAACEVAAELDTRLAQTGLDRELVEKAYCHRMEVRDIARWYGMNDDTVRLSISSAVSYISSGECQRWIDCANCTRFAKCRKKKKLKRQRVSYSEWCRRKTRVEGQLLKTS